MDFLVAVLATLGVSYFRDKLKHRAVKAVAKAILADPTNDTTNPAQAIREAWVLANHKVISKQVDALEAQHAAGKLRIEAATARGLEMGKGIDVTIVPRDGTEEFKSPWTVK